MGLGEVEQRSSHHDERGFFLKDRLSNQTFGLNDLQAQHASKYPDISIAGVSNPLNSYVLKVATARAMVYWDLWPVQESSMS
mmetsp:Transcript_27395/g.56919  ORF Transcript_27395/g.56919 Transcript_27395/m.56919 type:complete len:82 (-) Transcript_27395:69-314(-)